MRVLALQDNAEATMGSIDFAMLHNCQILRETGTTQNAAGTPVPSYSSTDSICLFDIISIAGNTISTSEPGKVIISSPVVFLPADTEIDEGDLISTTEQNWAGTYEVQSVNAPVIPFSGIIDHKEAFLKVIKKRGTHGI